MVVVEVVVVVVVVGDSIVEPKQSSYNSSLADCDKVELTLNETQSIIALDAVESS